ncbi:Uncharacterised protein [Edwardsiella tarda]|nr:Uncharacterised protein [Edwardsiella tarda]
MCVLQQRRGGARDLFGVFAAHFEADQDRRQLARFELAAHDGGKQLLALGAAEHLGLVQFLHDLLLLGGQRHEAASMASGVTVGVT